ARDATDTEGGIKHRLEKIGQELNDNGLRQRALDYLTQFLGVDGAVDAEETKFLDLAKAALKTGSGCAPGTGLPLAGQRPMRTNIRRRAEWTTRRNGERAR